MNDLTSQQIPIDEQRAQQIPADVIKYIILPFVHHLQQIDAVEKLLIQNDLESAFRESAKKGKVSAVAYLAKKYYGIPSTIIPVAAEAGHVDIVRYLCELEDDEGNPRCNPTDVGNDAVTQAAERGHLDIVRYLSELVGVVDI